MSSIDVPWPNCDYPTIPLLIETGRHSKIERQLRFCPFCPTIIEDEIHFLVQCPNYKDMREMREWGVYEYSKIPPYLEAK